MTIFLKWESFVFQYWDMVDSDQNGRIDADEWSTLMHQFTSVHVF